MKRLVLVSAVAGCLVAGCTTGQGDAVLEKEAELVRAENADLRVQIERLRAENADLRREVAAEAASAAAGNSRAIEELRRELDGLRGQLDGGREHEAVLVGPDVEERLLRKVKELEETVWELPPSGCVRVLTQIMESYPNTRAALKAQAVLGEWDAVGVEVTDATAPEIDERIRGLLRNRHRAWRRVQEAVRAAEAGEAAQAVRMLQEVADGRQGGPGRQALEILEGWGLAGVGFDEIDFDELGPQIRRRAAARAQLQAAMRSLERGNHEAAAKALRRIARKYRDLPQGDHARERLDDLEAELRERAEARRGERRDGDARRGEGRREEGRRRRERARDEGEREGRDAGDGVERREREHRQDGRENGRERAQDGEERREEAGEEREEGERDEGERGERERPLF